MKAENAALKVTRTCADSNVHDDVAALEELGLVARTEQGTVHVPFEAVEIHLSLADAA